MTNKPSPRRSLLQDFQDLGIVSDDRNFPGQVHVIREHGQPGGKFSLRARTGDDGMDIYDWKPDVRVKVINMTKEEALKLATLINETWPLDALGQI